MLQMLIDNFQIRSDKGIKYRTCKYATTKNNTGFIIACCLDNIDIIKLLTERYTNIIEQKDNKGNTGFMIACDQNKIDIIKLLIKRYPDIIQ